MLIDILVGVARYNGSHISNDSDAISKDDGHDGEWSCRVSGKLEGKVNLPRFSMIVAMLKIPKY